MSESLKSKITTLLTISLQIKILGLIYRFLLARILGIEGMKIISLLSPTMSLAICLSSMSIPLVINQKVSRNNGKKNRSNRQIILSSLYITLLTTLIVCLIIIFFGKSISYYIIKNDILYYPLLLILPVIFFSNCSGIFKGYLEGQKDFKITARANLYEQITKITLSLLLVYLLRNKGSLVMVIGALIGMGVSELQSLLFLAFKVSKRTSLKLQNGNKKIEVLRQAAPLTINHLIFSFVGFIEPLLFFCIMQKNNYTLDSAQIYYTLVTSYAFPLLTMAFFASHSLSKAIFPYISANDNNKDQVHNIINKSLLFCLIIGLLNFNLSYFYPLESLGILFSNTNALDIVKKLSIFYLFYYFNPVFVTSLQALNMEKKLLKNNIFSHFLEICLICILCNEEFLGMSGFIYSIGICFITSLFLHYRALKKQIRYKIPGMLIFIFLTAFIINYLLNKIFMIFLNHYVCIFLVSILDLFIAYFAYRISAINKSVPSLDA